ncbi:DNA repair protein RAD51 homolog 4-like isoform X2 [Biomphalaria glabrata]|uniref:DNA repair protein RAD51 homolog 4-like isoform X2 n=1 Tax=Biomphalaria glabrata TaxID=6526 RepID=A0A9W2YJ20_BIOGL|nr:DNA repair protein RAD51 homolog 4-like isoform X2 [Biomphalaria glabrata]
MTLQAGLCTALTSSALDKLRAHGVKTATDFIVKVKDIEVLSQETLIPYKDLCSIQRVLLAEHSAYPTLASCLYEKAIASLMILSTGCQSLDDLLDGGLYTGELTELAGDSVSGKTKICLWCAAMTVLVGDHSVVYIDSSSSFSAGYLKDIMSKNIGPGQSLSDDLIRSKLQKVKYTQVFDIYDLFSALDAIMTDLNQQTPVKYPDLKLLIVDSLASLIYPIMGGNISFCQGLICQLGLKLKQLATHYSLAVLVTNYLTSSFNGGKKKPALGKAWSHVPHMRVILQKPVGGQGPSREAVLVKSNRQTPKSALFSLDKDEPYEPG